MAKKQLIRLTEGDLHRVIKESVNKVLKEGRYSGEYDRTGSPLDDNEYVESLEYILDSITNGNISQAKEMISELSQSELSELIQLAREYDMLDDVLEYMR